MPKGGKRPKMVMPGKAEEKKAEKSAKKKKKK